MVYIIIDRHAYRDARALHNQLVIYVLKYLYVSACYMLKVIKNTYNEFHKTMIMTVYNCSVT